MFMHYHLLELVEGREKMPENADARGSWIKRLFDTYMLLVQAVGGRQLDHIKELLGDPECGPKAWKKLQDIHSPTHATGIVLLARRLRDIKFVDGEPMQPVLDEMRDIFSKLQAGGLVYPELVQCMEIVIGLPESWSALAINLNSQQSQWSLEYIRARISEEDLRRQSVDRSGMLLVMELEEGGVVLRRSGRARRMTTLRRRVLEVKTGAKEMYASIARSAVIAGESAINGLRTGPHLHGPISKEAKGVGSYGSWWRGG
ncbi:hypothetical protein CLOM_g20899 [Closterium sp. NIES-68]|nr:hypothetical protein CLOM_g20899 [Closterium sp. NIES-68]